MNMTEWALENKKVTYFAIMLLVVGGIMSFLNLGQLEDPEFSIKAAVVSVSYPGASAAEVEEEVTDKIEIALQEMPQLKHLYSVSRAGSASIKIDIKEEYWADRLPQVWDEVRKKVADVESTFPTGVGAVQFSDDFGFVYGFLMALSSNDYSDAQLETIADQLKTNLSLAEGVSRVELWGVQRKVVYLDMSDQVRRDMGLTYQDFQQTLQKQNAVIDSGYLNQGDERIRIQPSGSFNRPEDIGELVIKGFGENDTLLKIKDVAEVTVGYAEPAVARMRYNGKPAIGIAIANQKGGNVVDTGKNIDQALKNFESQLPIGMEVNKIAWQSDLVEDSINSFMISLVEAIIIVLVVLTIPMGWRMGVIIGTSLILTILATFMLMAVFKIDLQRMSLGALVIALGMMVDNAIVVADGMYERLKKGMNRRQAAIESAVIPAWPLLGATVVAVLAFYPIFASTANAGEYCRTLFIVVGMSLSISWLIALTVTPLQCIDLLPVPKASEENADSHAMMFKRVLLRVLRTRARFLFVMVMLLALAVYGFGYVSQMFFPDSSRSQFMVDVWEDSGTRFEKTEEDVKKIEAKLLNDPRVSSVSGFIGMGPPRFYLPVDSEGPQENYGQLIVNVHDWHEIDNLINDIDQWMAEQMPYVLTRSRKYGVGPSNPWKFEARFIGTAETTTQELRQVAEQAIAILKDSPLVDDVRMDIQDPIKIVHADYDQSRGRWAGISREDVGSATRTLNDGVNVGLYRERDDDFPIILRNVEEGGNIYDLSSLLVFPQNSSNSIPLTQVVNDLTVSFEDYAIVRWDRHRAVTVQASPKGVTFPELYSSVSDDIHNIPLPDGWSIYWAGEAASSTDAQKSLKPGVVPAVIIMVFIIVLLFNAYRPPLIIFITIPFALIGITVGLLVTGAPFGFMALLGAMSLSGMMIKNAIVLLDQINIELAAGKDRWHAVIDSVMSRLRPVFLAAATTVLGVVPLLQDVFWVSMAATIMFGLAFGTILTLLVLPTLYVVLYKVKEPGSSAKVSLNEHAKSKFS